MKTHICINKLKVSGHVMCRLVQRDINLSKGEIKRLIEEGLKDETKVEKRKNGKWRVQAGEYVFIVSEDNMVVTVYCPEHWRPDMGRGFLKFNIRRKRRK